MMTISPAISLDRDRCILCYRCVNTAEQLTEKRVHGVLNRGEVSEISTYIAANIDNEFSGNVIDVLQNDGKGYFADVTSSVAPSLLNIGMITSGEWMDYDNDVPGEISGTLPGC